MLLPELEEAAAAFVVGATLPMREDRLPEGDVVVCAGIGVWLAFPTEARGAEVVNGEDLVPVDPDSFEVAGVEVASEGEIEGEGVGGTVATVLVEDPVGLRMRRWVLGACLESFFPRSLGIDAVVVEAVAVVWLEEESAAASTELSNPDGDVSEMTSSASVTGDEAVPKDVLRRIVVALRLAKSFIYDCSGFVCK